MLKEGFVRKRVLEASFAEDKFWVIVLVIVDSGCQNSGLWLLKIQLLHPRCDVECSDASKTSHEEGSEMEGM